MVMTPQCRVISCNKCTTLPWGVEREIVCRGGQVEGLGRTGGTWDLFTQFHCEPESALKSKAYYLKKISKKDFFF